jgi:hypothetical protein
MVEGLCNKHEALSLNPSTGGKKKSPWILELVLSYALDDTWSLASLLYLPWF